jgi:hypothetical protein
MSTKLELETWAGKTIQAYKDQAAKAGLVLHSVDAGQDSGNFPDRPHFSLRRFRRIMAKSKGEPKRVVTHMHRQLVSTRDSNGKPTKIEYLTYNGFFEVKDHRGVPYNADLQAGVYQRPKIIVNPGRKFNPDTGEPIGPEFTFSGEETIYTIEVPKSKTERKKLIDE